MSVTLRGNKGSALTHNELDGNFSNLVLRVNALENQQFDGNYNSLANKPVLFSGNYNDLTNKPTLFNGDYNNLTNKPNLDQYLLTSAAFSGDYNDLLNKPYIFSGSYDNLTGKPSFATVAFTGSFNDLANVPFGFTFSGSYNELTDKPVLFSGSYTDLTDKPVLFSGSYNSLTDKPTIPADIADLTDNTNLLGGGSSFDQSLNTTDAVEFSSVTTPALVNGTDVVIQSSFGTDNYTWTFYETGQLVIPGNILSDGELLLQTLPTLSGIGSDVTISAGESGDDVGGNVNIYAGVGSGESPTNGAINIGTANDGAINIGGTTSTTTFGGTVDFGNASVTGLGNVSELNDDANGNKLIIESEGNLVLTDASGTIESPSGGGSNRGLTWDYGEANGGSNSHILELSGEGDILEIRAFVTSEVEAPVRLTAGSPGNPKSLDWTPDGKLQRNADFLLSVAPGDSTESIWNFGTDGTTNIPGALTFSDGTVQTTAYTGTSEGAPLFVAINSSGESSYSSDGESWTNAGRLTFDGVDAEGLGRVAVGQDFIVYIAFDVNNDIDDQLFYATDPGESASLVSIPLLTEDGHFDWNDIERGGNYVVAVGEYYDAVEDNEIPVWAYTTNGSSWTVGQTDNFYQAEIGGQFASVDYDGTGWLIVNSGNGGGAFYITSLSSELTIDNYIDFISNGLEEMPAIDSVVWTGDRWVLKDDDSPSIIVSNGANPLTATWTLIDMQAVVYGANFRSGFGGFYEDAGGTIDGTHWYMIASEDGQIIATSDGGDTFVTAIPDPYTGVIETVNIEGDAAITGYTGDDENTVWNGRISDGVDHITISNASPSGYNGSFYTRERGTPDVIFSNSSSSNWTPGLYENVFLGGGEVIVNITVISDTPRFISDITIVTTDGSKLFLETEFTVLGSVLGGTDGVDDAVLFVADLTGNDSEWVLYDSWDPDLGFTGANTIDWSLLDPFVSADFTLSRGTYIDAAGFGLGKFLVGNDDEQLYTSTDLETWTKVDDLSEEGFNYWNDISFNANFGGTLASSTGNFVFSGNTVTNDAGMLLATGRGTLAIGTDMEFPGEPDHFHIAFDGSNTNIPEADLFLGDDYNHVKIKAFSQGIEIRVTDRIGDDDQYIWEFTADGTTYLPNNSTAPISYLQTPDNNQNIALYLGAGDGVSIVADNYGDGTARWDFTSEKRLQFPGSGPVYTIGETEGGIQLASDYAVILTANTANEGQEKNFIVGDDGVVRLPGATISPPVTPTPGTIPVGEATAITVTNSPNPNWVTGSGVFVNGITFVINVDGSGNATVPTINDGGTGHYVGETFGPLVGTALGGSSPADDVYFEVTAINTGSLTALDLTKQTQILTAIDDPAGYSLADGEEGQIMYFVPGSGTNDGIYVLVANARIYNDPSPEDVTDYSWVPFGGETLAPTTIAMAIFADGAWCLRGGSTD